MEGFGSIFIMNLWTAFESFGQQLIDKKHYAEPEVLEKMDSLQDARDQLEKYVSTFSI